MEPLCRFLSICVVTEDGTAGEMQTQREILSTDLCALRLNEHRLQLKVLREDGFVLKRTFFMLPPDFFTISSSTID